MTAPAHLDTLRLLTARKLRSYTITQIGIRWVVIRHTELHGDYHERACIDLFEAIEHLANKLPPITDPPDIVRTT